MHRIVIANPIRTGRWWRLALVLVAWVTVAAPTVAGIVGIRWLRAVAADLPAVPDLARWERSVPRTNLVLAADGTVLAEIPFRVGDKSGRRYPVRYEQIPRPMVEAVLAAEDIRFFAHAGVDLHAVARAAWANYRAGRVVEGASTITQQVARNLLPEQIGNERTIDRKLREALLARRIERRYNKQRIFEVYVNHVFLGANAYGIAAAARAYFDKRLDQLELAEMAMIAGLAQAPGRADPFKNPEAAKARRNSVLERMLRAELITEPAHAQATARPVALTPPKDSYGELAPWITERARKDANQLWPELYSRGGLIIETTAQPALAVRGQQAAVTHATELAQRQRTPPPQVGAVVWDYRTGYVEQVIGGLDWNASQFDRATQACRQPGSAFKPLVYAAALEHGVITAGTPLRDAPIAEWDDSLGVHWKPTNSGRSFRGVALAQDALAASLNTPAVDVLDRVGPSQVIGLAHRLGITSELAPVRPLALGASCVIPIELAGAFATFARGGTNVAPVFATRVRNGEQMLSDRSAFFDPTLAPRRRLDRLAAHLQQSESPALAPDTAFLITAMLRAVVSYGTGRAAAAIGRDAGGKTGTTNDNTDAWFVGFTGRVVAAVWIGHDNPATSLGPRADGSHAALPLWITLIQLAEADRPKLPIPGPPPDGLIQRRVDRETGKLARPGAGGAVELYFVEGTEPTDYAGQVQGVSPDLSRVGRDF